MQDLTCPIVAKTFSDKIGKTAIECKFNNKSITVWANGDVSNSPALLCNVRINQVGDTFVASKDSTTFIAASTKDDPKATKPAFLKGETVTRLKESVEFKSLTGTGTAAQFAQAANAFGLQLVVQM